MTGAAFIKHGEIAALLQEAVFPGLCKGQLVMGEAKRKKPFRGGLHGRLLSSVARNLSKRYFADKSSLARHILAPQYQIYAG